jgi:hypothetical protein
MGRKKVLEKEFIVNETDLAKVGLDPSLPTTAISSCSPNSPHSTRIDRRVSRDELIDAIRKTRGLLYLTSNILAVSYKRISQIIDDDPELTAILKEERGKTLDRAEAKLMQAVDKGEQWAITMLLRTLGRERGYVERTETANVSNVRLEIVEEIVDHKSKDIKIKVAHKSASTPIGFNEEVIDAEG